MNDEQVFFIWAFLIDRFDWVTGFKVAPTQNDGLFAVILRRELLVVDAHRTHSIAELNRTGQGHQSDVKVLQPQQKKKNIKKKKTHRRSYWAVNMINGGNIVNNTLPDGPDRRIYDVLRCGRAFLFRHSSDKGRPEPLPV